MTITAAFNQRPSSVLEREPLKAVSKKVHHISIVVPVYQGENTLEALTLEILPLTQKATLTENREFVVSELILVLDGALDNSETVIQKLALRYPFIRPVWLSRNFGQHAATLAGIASSSGEWVVTLDEDGQHNPADIKKLFKAAISGSRQLVYGIGKNTAPHGLMRNYFSRIAHWIFTRLLDSRDLEEFSSFRLIRGDIGRSLAAFCGNGVYLDAALKWVASNSASHSVELRQERRPATNYSFSKLVEHFTRLVFCSRRTPLRLVLFMGGASVVLSLILASYALYQKLTGQVPVEGWTSLFITISFFSGVLMLSLGILAEYIGLILSLSMGKPLYLIQPEPPNRPQIL